MNLARRKRGANPRLPFAPLRAILPPTWEARDANSFNPDGTQMMFISTEAQVARLAGCDVRNVWRWHRSGLSWEIADLVAIRAGFHPGLVWGDLWWQIVPLAEPEPGGRFCGRHPQHKEREAA